MLRNVVFGEEVVKMAQKQHIGNLSFEVGIKGYFSGEMAQNGSSDQNLT